jgi:hypothetical protein
MGDPLKKVQAGQRLEIPADAYNAFVDAARAERSRRHDVAQDAGRETRQTGIIRVRNTTGTDQDRYSILALREPIISPSDNLQEFKNRVSLDGEAPTGPARRERFAILLEPLAADRIGRGIVAGVTPVRIDVIRETDVYAEPIAGTTTQLRSVPFGQTRILWKEAGTGVKWAVVRLSERARFAVFQLAGSWQAATSPEPDGWMKMPGCRPVFYFTSSHTYAPDSDEATETIWHQAGYPPVQRSAVISLHKSTGRVPAKFGSGDWVWCTWNEYENRWQVLGDYEDHWRFVLSSSLARCGSAPAALVLYDGAKWCPQPLVFTVVDSLGVVPLTGVPAGKYGLAKHFADSGVWEVIALADGCCDPGSGGSGSGSGSCVTVVTKVLFDPITCRLNVCTREICLPAGATIGEEHCGGSGQ